MSRAYTLKGDCLIVHRDLTELDIFVKDFLDVFQKYSPYLVVSGFVSIAAGRTRGTEDVDVLFPLMDRVRFGAFFEEIIRQGFWCYQGDTPNEAYRSVKNMTSLRFARQKQLFPNIELIPVTEAKRPQYFELTHPQKIKIKDFEFLIPPLEFEILYKEIVLAGDKDIADARHLRVLFSAILRKERFKEFESIIKG